MATSPRPLCTYTVEEAEKLSPKEANDLLRVYNNTIGGESGERELSGYVSIEDGTATDIMNNDRPTLPGAAAMWNYWKEKKTANEMEELTVADAANPEPEVLAVVEKKAAGAAKTDISFADMVALFRKDPTNRKRYDDSMGRNDDYGRDRAKAMVTNWYPNHLKKAAAEAAAKAAAPMPGGGRKGHASTLRGIGKMGPAMLHKELERYEKIKAHLQSKYAHVVPMGETKRYTKEEVESAIKQLKDKIAAKGTGGRRHTRRHRRARHTRSTRRR